MTETEEKIANLISPMLPVGANITPDAALWHGDVSFPSGPHPAASQDPLDSLDRVDLSMQLEEQFEISISDADAGDYAKFGTVAAIAAFVDQKLAEKAAA